MGIFIDFKIEKVVQVNEKFRIDATRTFKSSDEAAFIEVEIDPGDGTFRSVFNAGDSSKWFLDWAFTTEVGSPFTVNVRATTDGAPVVLSKTITVLTAAEDNLFSTDEDLTSIESEIYRYLPRDGSKAGFLHVHRASQKRIMDELDANGNTNRDGTRLTKDQLIEVDDVNQWSKFMTLAMIFQDLSNKPEDTFDVKAKFYMDRADFYKERNFLRIDFNKDNEIDESEKAPIRSARLVRM